MEFKFSGQTFEKKIQIRVRFNENRPLGAELFDGDGRTDRQTDMTKLTAGFGNFAKPFKYQTSYPVGLL